jgi:hypothetical protein
MVCVHVFGATCWARRDWNHADGSHPRWGALFGSGVVCDCRQRFKCDLLYFGPFTSRFQVIRAGVSRCRVLGARLYIYSGNSLIFHFVYAPPSSVAPFLCWGANVDGVGILRGFHHVFSPKWMVRWSCKIKTVRSNKWGHTAFIASEMNWDRHNYFGPNSRILLSLSSLSPGRTGQSHS